MKLKLFLTVVFVYIAVFSYMIHGAEYVSMDLKYDGQVHKYNAEKVILLINGSEVKNMPMPPIIFDNYTVVPAREVFEALGAEVGWNKDTYEVTVSYNSSDVVLKIGNKTAYVNGKEVAMEIPAKIINDKTMIPLRFVSTSVGLNVGWDATTRTASVTGEMDNAGENNENPIQNNRPPVQNDAPPEKISSSVDSITFPSDKTGDFIINASMPISSINTMLLSENRLVVDIYDAKMNLEETVFDTSHFAVMRVRTGQNQTDPVPVTRIVFDMYRNDEEYSVNLSADKKSVVVSFENDSILSENVNSITGNLYYDSKNASIVIKKFGREFDINNISHNDEYYDKRYSISFNGNYTEIFKNEILSINDIYLGSVEIKAYEQNTMFVFNEKQIYTYNVEEDAENVYIRVVQPKEKFKNIVVLDAGHGGHDQGAAANGLIEKNITLDIVNRVLALLESDGTIKGYATRTSDVYPSFEDRNNMGNLFGDVFISIHINSAGSNTSASGTEVYKLNPNDTGRGITSDLLAASLQSNLLKYLGSIDRKVKSENFIVLRQSTVPAALCEIGFITNPNESAKLGTEEYRQLAAQAVYQSVKELFEKYPSNR